MQQPGRRPEPAGRQRPEGDATDHRHDQPRRRQATPSSTDPDGRAGSGRQGQRRVQVLQLGPGPRTGDVHPERHRQQGRRHRGQPARPRRARPRSSRRRSTPASPSWPSTPATATGRRPARCPSTASPRSWPASSPAPSSTSSAPRTHSASSTPRVRSSSRTAARASASKFSGQTEKLYADGTDTPPTSPRSRPSCGRTPASTPSSPSARRSASPCRQQLEQDGSTAKVVTYAFNNDLIPLLQNGKVAFTIDQQPYLQGYLSIDSLWLYHRNKSVIGAQQSSRRPARSSSTSPTSVS